jgi:hypothetical protein
MHTTASAVSCTKNIIANALIYCRLILAEGLNADKEDAVVVVEEVVSPISFSSVIAMTLVGGAFLEAQFNGDDTAIVAKTANTNTKNISCVFISLDETMKWISRKQILFVYNIRLELTP